ncbi:hypothetical protein CLAFUW4_08835 [Fulvia fulva]|uniref:DUF7702 domain-containing protein n=1 Tax=Passalora fulva TaxID=5499 RepID=A0A9Q8PFI9_PASFU|nr:uncharacterized protein CLAFUR5_08941 [Fulvia fulva]KAK4614129.1 hypothetical protein CLAFUR4_08841 [Fulvia fulva]KAK4614724.1 hypothetical protein CLAFUR0_08833 [Fulvia fulva]UJO21659.1 hypothetical protein CLAFUR5_08941 [Fulvia fulva]WPV20386.1 hypothetical protein CLAFUW4_08835 [Fulvia fulva]WPV34798.1 hypothetical protein CLAFUW7_08836 [Fulvia fulva]
MHHLTSRGDLSIAELIFFSPSLLAALFICTKQGFPPSSGWLYLVLLSILRLIGASVTLYMESNNDYSPSLVETVAITSSIGRAPLLLVLLGLLERIYAAVAGGAFNKSVFRPIHLVGLVALISAIVGGSMESRDKGSEQDTGKALRQAGSVLFLVIYFALAGLTGLTALRRAYIASTDRKLIIAGCAVLPFLLVRMIYTVVVSFAHPGSHFYYLAPSARVTAFMMFLMEAICIVLYSWAGLITPKAVTPPSQTGRKDLESNGVDLSRHSQGRVRP